MEKKEYNPKRAGRSLAALLLAASLVLASCHRKDWDEYYQPQPVDPEHPELVNPGEVTVVPTLPDQDTPPKDAEVIVTLTGADGKPFNLTPGQPTDAEAGTYTATSMTVVPDKGTAQQPGTGVGTLPQGTHIAPGGIITLPSAADGRIANLPQLYAGTGTVTVAQNNSVSVNIPQQPMTRPVQVNGLLQGLDPTTLKSITVKLDGVAATREITKPFGRSRGMMATGDTRASVSYYVDCTLTDALTADWSTLFRLLGIDPAMKQTLRITVEYKSPSAPAYTYEADVTTLLAGFNTGPATQPAVLNVTLSFGITGVTGTITGWTPGWDEEVPGS